MIEFFNHYLKKKRFVLIYSPYKDLFNYGITFVKKNKQTDIAGFSLKARKKNKDYILKSLFFDGNRLVQKQKKEFDNKNIVFIKCQGNFVPYKLNITKAYYDKICNTNDKLNLNDFFFDAFPNPTVFKNFVKSLVFTKSPYPFYFNRNGTILMEEVDVYLSPDLYNNNKSFLKNIKKKQVKLQLIQMR